MELVNLTQDLRIDEKIAASEHWQAWLLPLPAFPVPEKRIESYRASVQKFAETLVQEYQMRGALALQLWKLSGKLGGDLLQQHLDDWPSDLGFGVWPDRDAPAGWNEDSIQDAAAAVYRGDEPALPMHRALLFKIEARATYNAALHQMSGFGATVQIFSRALIEDVRKRGLDEFLPRISDHRFRGGRVYLPMLDQQSLRAARSFEELERWLCGADVYLRESAEDKGLLVVSRLSGATMTHALETLATAII